MSNSFNVYLQKANQNKSRQHNQRLVLRTIYEREKISRADISRVTNLTRTTVSEIASGLIEIGLIEECGVAKSQGGRPPTFLKISENSRNLICVDLSGDAFTGAIVNLSGEIINRIQMPAYRQDKDDATFLVYELIDNLISMVTEPVLGIGIGTPGLVDPDRGIVNEAVNLNWRNFHLTNELMKKYKLPVYIANDGQVSALAEFTFGKNNSENNLILIKIGRGVGSGIVINRNLHYGDKFGAGEIGHIKIVEDGELCRCGNYGCLETLVSNTAIITKAKKIIKNNLGSNSSDSIDDQLDITIDDVVRAYEAGEEGIIELVKSTGRYLGVAIANIISILNINTIVISGEVAMFGNGLISEIEQYVKGASLSILSNEMRISTSLLGEDSVILGVSSLILRNELGLFNKIERHSFTKP